MMDSHFVGKAEVRVQDKRNEERKKERKEERKQERKKERKKARLGNDASLLCY